MKASHWFSADRLKQIPPGLFFIGGILYELGLYVLDSLTPPDMSFTLFYMLGIAFVGWTSGKRPALLLSGLAGVLLAWHDWVWPQNGPDPLGVVLWNVCTRLVIMAAAGVLAAEMQRLTRHLGTAVEHRTAQWRTEAEKHKATASHLAESLALNEKILQESAMGVVAYKASGECVFVNEALARLTGGTREEILHGNFRQLESWKHSGLLRAAEEVLARAEPRSGEFCDQTRFGKTVWADCHLTSFKSGGEPHLLVLGYDITERKRGELLLRAQRDLGVGLSATGGLPMALKGLLDVVLQLEAVECAAVYFRETRTGALELAAHAGSISDAFLQLMRHHAGDTERARLVAAGTPVYGAYSEVFTSHHPVADGEGLRAIAIVPLCYEGQVIGSLNCASRTRPSIPEQSRIVLEALAAQAAGAISRIRAEAALQESQQRLQTIINGVPIVLFAGNSEGVLTFEEGQALAALGTKPGEHLGKFVWEAFGEFPIISEYIRRTLAGEEFSAVLPMGKLVFDCRYSPMRDGQGKITGFMGVATNITDRQRLERQILEVSDREQARVGQEIHDGLCQQLVSLAFDTGSLERQLRGSRRPAATTAARISKFLDQAITEARQLSHGLFPIRLDMEGLPPALEELAKTTQERFHVPCRFECVQPVWLPSRSMATHLYRIAQEGVNNAVKHSRANSIAIRLSADSQRIQLCVEDDGIGLPDNLFVGRNPDLRPAAIGSASKLSGMGLHIMDYRARSMGGILQLNRQGESGTRLCCVVPVGVLGGAAESPLPRLVS